MSLVLSHKYKALLLRFSLASIIILFFACAPSSLINKNRSSTIELNPKLLANSIYQIKSVNSIRSTSKTDGKFDIETSGTIDINEFLNSSSSNYNAEIITLNTHQYINDRLSLTMEFDSIDSQLDLYHLNKLIPPDLLDNLHENLLNTTYFGHYTDSLLIKIDSSQTKKRVSPDSFYDALPTQNLAPLTIKNKWNIIKSYPKGVMTVGDTFYYEKPKKSLKKKKRKTWSEEEINEIKDSTRREKLRALNKQMSSFKSRKQKEIHYYILETIQDEKAHFSIYKKEELKIDSMMIANTLEKGTLIYDLADKYYSLYSSVTNSTMTTYEAGVTSTITTESSSKIEVQKLP